MSKKPDFGSDLAALDESVSAGVGDVLKALQQKRTESRPMYSGTEQPRVTTAIERSSELTSNDTKRDETAGAAQPRRQRSKNRPRLGLEIERSEVLENVTTRLRFQTNELLTEAALRQRLKKQNPATRQDIVEAALTDWFRKNGYSRSGENDGGN